MEERIKDLKNKNIKIKRVKKHEMAESVILHQEDMERPFSYSQVERVPSVAQSVVTQPPLYNPSPIKHSRKQENAMFYSTAHDLQGRGEDMGRQITENLNNFQAGQGNNMKNSIMSTFAAVDMRASNYNTETKNKILVEDPRRKNKRENPLFYSTNQQVAPLNTFLKPTTGKKKDVFMEVYALGKTVNSVLEREETRVNEIAALVEKEKKKVDQDLDTMVQTVISMFD